ncbi:MAG: mRNA surveillance protein pelota [Ferroplasma sp.]
MKIIEEIPHESKIVLLINSMDDLWYLKNILNSGDLIIAYVFRRIDQNAEMTRAKATERKRIKITLRIESFDFQPYTDKIKILGEIIEGENSGSHQSIMVGLDDEITLVKNFTGEEFTLLKEAINNYYKNSIIFVSMDDESALIAILKSYGIQDIAEIYSGKSGKDYEIKESKSSYYTEMAKVIKTAGEISSLIILGPGFEPRKFYEYLKNDPYFRSTAIYNVAETENGKRGIYEFLHDEKNAELLKGAKMAGDERLIEKFLKNLNKTGLSIYGYDEIRKYAAMNMVDDILISESKFKTPEARELLDSISGANIHIISEYTDSGNIIKKFGGYCAILRYKY